MKAFYQSVLVMLIVMAFYFAVFMPPVIILNIINEYRGSGAIPLKQIIALSLSIIFIVIATYYSNSPKWKALVFMLGLSVAFCTFIVGGIGFMQLINPLLDEPQLLNIPWAIFTMVTGLGSTVLIWKGITKWTN